MNNIITVLVGLRLKNVALIKSLNLAFDRGLTVLTGETGAGKSILLDALDALFFGSGFTSGSKLLRAGSEFAHIEGTFIVNKKVENWLEGNSLESFEDELVVSREWRKKGKGCISRSRINGVIVNKQQIISLRPLLIDLTLQGQSQRFSTSSQQLLVVDDYARDFLQPLILKANKSWNKWQKSHTLLNNIQLEKEKIHQKHEESKFILNELEEANLYDPNEDRKLKEEENRLVNGVRLQESLSKLFSYIKENSDQNSSVYDLFNLSIQELKKMIHYDSSLENLLEKALDIYSPIQDLIFQLEQYSSSLETDPATLNQIQERIFEIQRLERVHSLKLPQLISLRDKLRNLLVDDNFDEKLNKISLEERLAKQERDVINNQLTQARKKVALKLEKMLMTNLSPMGLSNVVFKIQIESVQPNSKGADAVKFLFSANPGQPLAPLIEIASGGEMSRFILALKATISQNDNPSTMLFDEIDAGVSGRVSSSIASLLKDLSQFQQVFCVTHQPLVAAAADHHFSVHKVVEDGITTSSVSNLRNLKQRQKELAELAGGNFTEASNYAASLLEHHAA